jgi:hypothetical protein
MKEQIAIQTTRKWLFQPNAWWIGVHYSKYNKRYCINLVPTVTLVIVKPGGRIPY